VEVSQHRRLPDDRRAEILQAAVRTISERGICDTRIADVAESAGASPALVIYYFGTKDRLLSEALAFADARFYEKTAAQLDGITSARDRLTRLVEMSCSTGPAGEDSWQDEWVLWLDMWARAPRDPDVARDREALDRRWRETIAGIVRDGQRNAEFGEIDAEEFAIRFGALIDGLAIQVVLGDPAVSPALMFDLCMRTAASELGFEWKRPRQSEGPVARGRGRPARTRIRGVASR
jgi:AcrR family transcriptional regulator